MAQVELPVYEQVQQVEVVPPTIPGVNPIIPQVVVPSAPPVPFTPSAATITPLELSQQLGSLVPSVGADRLLFLTTTNYLGALAFGEPGQVLQSMGADQLPQWASIPSGTTNIVTNTTSNTTNNTTNNVINNLNADWASPGVIGSTTPNTGTFTQLNLSGATYPLRVGSSNQLQINNDGRLELRYVGDSGHLSSSGGALYLNNTQNIGSAIGIYSNAGADALGNMINVKVDNPLYDNAAFYMSYDGNSNAVEIVNNGSGTASNALSVTGFNINDSTVGFIGYELARGTVKITHNRPPGGTDSSASGLSIDLRGSGTLAQGVYVDSTEVGGTLGNLLRLRNESIDKFVVNYQGNLFLAGNITQGANGTNTSYTKYGTTAGDEFFVGSNASFRIQRAASNSEAFRVQVVGDTQGRWVGTSDGRLRWGDGSNVTDTTLRRTAVGLLTLEGSLAITGTTGLNGVTYTWPGTAGSNGQVLTTNGSGTLSWTDATGGGQNYWQLNGTILSPANSTLDLAVGGTSSSSAVFSVRGMTGDVIHGAYGTNTTYTKFGNTTGDQFFIGTNGAFRSQRAASNSEAFRVQVNGDSQGRLVVTSDGRLTWGSGSLAGDVTLRRGGTGLLWLEGGIVLNNSNADADVIVKGVSDSNLLFADASANAIGIGTSSPLAGLHLHKNGTGNSILIVNQLDTTADILTASVSGGLRMRLTSNGTIITPNGSLGVGASTFGDDGVRVLAIANSTAPTSSITNGVQLYATDDGGFHRLHVRDEAGNVTIISPHSFSLIPSGPSESLAWAYYSERNNQAINADITRALRLVENISGQQLIYTKDLTTGAYTSMAPAGLKLADTPLFQELQQYSQTQQLDLEAVLAPYAKQSELAEVTQHLTLADQLWSFMSQVVFKAKATFEQQSLFMAEAVFKRGVRIEGPVQVDSQTAGWAEIPAGAKRVRVTFTKSFTSTPQVYLDAAAIGGAVKVEETSSQGFVINLSLPVAETTRIKWLAVVGDVAGAQVDVLETGEVNQPVEPVPLPASPTPSPSAEELVSPEPIVSPEPVASSEPEDSLE